MTDIHKTALVAANAQLGEGVTIGPFAIVGDNCVIGDGCAIAARAVLERNVILAANVSVGIGSILGGDPQDLKYRGEPTTVEIGEGTRIREYSTINRGTTYSHKTTVGRDCFIMSYVHLAHDCHVGDNVVIANAAQLAGHVTIDSRATISGMCGIHQFVRIGTHSIIGGASRVPQDVPPYVKAVGSPLQLFGLNTIGLKRSGISEPVRGELKRAYRLFFRSGLNLSQARERAAVELEQFPEVQTFLRFFEGSQRGVGF